MDVVTFLGGLCDDQEEKDAADKSSGETLACMAWMAVLNVTTGKWGLSRTVRNGDVKEFEELVRVDYVLVLHMRSFAPSGFVCATPVYCTPGAR